MYWPLATFHELYTSYRHANDQPYLEVLHGMRSSLPNDAHMEYIHSLAIEEADIVQHIADVGPANITVICTHREDVQHYNAHIFQQLFPDPATHVALPTLTNGSHVPELQEWLQEQDFNECPMLAVGARVMLTRNLNVTKGAANGTLAEVVSISNREDSSVKCISVRLLHNDHVLKVRHSKFDNRYINGRRYYRCSMPLILAYSMTGHKCQVGGG
jgi:hypothetical protein